MLLFSPCIFVTVIIYTCIFVFVIISVRWIPRNGWLMRCVHLKFLENLSDFPLKRLYQFREVHNPLYFESNDFLTIFVLILLKNNVHTINAHILSAVWWIFNWGTPPAWPPPSSGYSTFSGPHKHPSCRLPARTFNQPLFSFSYRCACFWASSKWNHTLCSLVLACFCSALCRGESPHGCVCLQFVCLITACYSISWPYFR